MSKSIELFRKATRLHEGDRFFRIRGVTLGERMTRIVQNPGLDALEVRVLFDLGRTMPEFCCPLGYFENTPRLVEELALVLHEDHVLLLVTPPKGDEVPLVRWDVSKGARKVTVMVDSVITKPEGFSTHEL